MHLALKVLLSCLLLLCTPALAFGHGAEQDVFREHTVYLGQRLGSIAKRYNVSIAALCNANGIQRESPIRPGQRLLIPTRKDQDGNEARALRTSGKWPPKGDGPSSAAEADAPPPLTSKPRTHTVYRGQRLGSIAKRYNVTTDALCSANGIKANDPIKPAQKLLIPPRYDKSGSRTREWRLEHDGSGNLRRRGKRGSWSQYAKAANKRGYVSLIGHQDRWEGYVLGQKLQVLGQARRGVSRVLTAPSNRQPVDARLIRLLADVSDTFGGRPLRIISGYRTTSFVKDSKHKSGRAVDFRIPGVPNEALRDYLRTVDNVGVGYYPNSTFVHLDVRKHSTYWIDYAGPGEAPKLKPR